MRGELRGLGASASQARRRVGGLIGKVQVRISDGVWKEPVSSTPFSFTLTEFHRT
jgi:hypothetical protein